MGSSRRPRYLAEVESQLAGVPIFAGLTDEAQALLFKRAESMDFMRTETILREGETGSRFYLIKSGAVRIVKNFGTSDETLLALLGPREFFGEMCIFETLPRAATVQAAEQTEVISLPATAFYQLYEARPDQYSILLLNIARDISRRLRKIDEAYAGRV